MFHNMNITSSALTASRLRMDVISSNLANVETTRGKYVNGEWVPYRRKMVVLQEQGRSFASHLQSAKNNEKAGSGVRVTQIAEDQSPLKMVYNPEHPDADDEGFVQMPNVDPLKEMVDFLNVTRIYDANITALNATKSILMKTLEIGK